MSLDEEQYLILKRQEDAMRRNKGATLTSGSSHSNSIAGSPSCGSSRLQSRSSDPSQTCGTGVNGDISSQLDDPLSNTVTLHAYEECPWPLSSLGEPYDSYGFDDDGPKVEKRLASKEEIQARATEAKVEGRSSLPDLCGFCAEWSEIEKWVQAAAMLLRYVVKLTMHYGQDQDGSAASRTPDTAGMRHALSRESRGGESSRSMVENSEGCRSYAMHRRHLVSLSAAVRRGVTLAHIDSEITESSDEAARHGCGHHVIPARFSTTPRICPLGSGSCVSRATQAASSRASFVLLDRFRAPP